MNVAGTSETLPCGVVRESRPIDLGTSGTGRTVRWTLNTNSENYNSIPSQGGNDIVLRFDSTAINGGTVRVDLASPEDISLGTDSSRAVGAFGSTV